MKIQLKHLVLRAKRATVQINFSEVVTFLHGPVSTGKSTVARLVDYCLGGELERTPAIQSEFVAAELSLILGDFDCTLERASEDTQYIRVTWSGNEEEIGSVNAPLSAQELSLVDGAAVHNFSDLIFHLCGIQPIKVRQRTRDPDSPLIRLSIRDIWTFCYLDQLHLDSSFFHLEDPFRGRKTQDAMRFFTGLHSERLNQLDIELTRTIDLQRSKREAVHQIRAFMQQFELGSELDLAGQLQTAEQQLQVAEQRKTELERTRSAQTHPSDELRGTLRQLSAEIEDIRKAIGESEVSVSEQQALRAELITAKTKAERADQAGTVLDDVRYQRCPECSTDISNRMDDAVHCRLCGSDYGASEVGEPLELEALRRDLNERIDQIADSISRRERELNRMSRQLRQAEQRKLLLDRQLQEELARYDSAFVESIRGAEREIATLIERIASLQRLQLMPQAINDLEREAGALQGDIDRLRTSLNEERARLQSADANIAAIATEFKRVMMDVSFPGVSEEDEVVIDPRNWKPVVIHGEQEWTFWDAGSGGKKTLFNVCYALAIHAVALERDMPVPRLLIIDSPTKNISDDENPELVRSLYNQIYQLAEAHEGTRLQFLLIDSDLVEPEYELAEFSERRMAGEPDAPSLIPYYVGP
jgi:hypothetical protein